jgi:membrane protein insertase Oxa1/YidC/SpoIIIJ
MFLQSKLMPMQAPAADPAQAQQQQMMTYMMPAIFGVMMFFWKLPSAFTLYWLGLNAISVIQTAQIRKHTRALGLHPAPGGAALPAPVTEPGSARRVHGTPKRRG